MTFPISSVAQGRFIEFKDLLSFVRSKVCPKGVWELESEDPLTNTWYVDEVVDAFFAGGGKRLSHEEIIRRQILT
jgi:hypothetical protein